VRGTILCVFPVWLTQGDNGANFVGKLTIALLKALGIKQLTTSPDKRNAGEMAPRPEGHYQEGR